MDGKVGTLYDLQYLSGENFKDRKDRVKNWKGEVLKESDLMKILTPLIMGNSQQIEALNELQFLYDCREFGKPKYELNVMSL